MESAFPEDLRSASFLGSFNSLFPGVGGGQTSTEREAAARLPLPSPRRAAGGWQLTHRRGALHRRPIRPPQSGLRVGVIITIARRRARRPGGSGSSPRRGPIGASPPFPRAP